MNDLTIHNVFPTGAEIETIRKLGEMAVRSGFIPSSIKTPEQAVVILLKGKELGIPPMQAFSSIAVVNGRPAMSAELMLSLIYRNVRGAVVSFVETTATTCVIEARRPGGKPTVFGFSMDDAKRAGLAGKDPWTRYPAAMLRARCISAMARAMFPDALSGVVYVPEELGADVDEDGDVIQHVPSRTALPPASAASIPVNGGSPQAAATKEQGEDFATQTLPPIGAETKPEPGIKTSFMRDAMNCGWAPEDVGKYARARWQATAMSSLSPAEKEEFARVVVSMKPRDAMEALKSQTNKE